MFACRHFDCFRRETKKEKLEKKAETSEEREREKEKKYTIKNAFGKWHSSDSVSVTSDMTTN